MSNEQPILLRLACAIQRMDFGPHGDDSLAYQLFKKGGHAEYFGEKSDGKDTPFAELWMGSGHEKGISKIREPASLEGQELSKVLLGANGEQFLGKKLLKRFPKIAEDAHGGVPFIFKVLSAGKALPLQVHPNMQQGESLRANGVEERADRTTFDSMHKPEIALALTDFEAFVGFAPRATIVDRLSKLPEFRELASKPSQEGPDLPLKDVENVYDDLLSGSKASWRDVMSGLAGRMMVSSKSQRKTVIDKILARNNKEPIKGAEKVVSLIARVNEQHPGGDSGVLFAPLFMNHVSLKPGQCIYAPADTAHAWLSGSIIECMPSSVNVINSGFGPEPTERTIELFTKMLSYKDLPPKDFLLEPKSDDGDKSRLYEVPEKEFNIVGIDLKPHDTTSIDGSSSGSEGIAVIFGFEGDCVLKATRGNHVESHTIEPGSVVLVASGAHIGLKANEHKSFQGYVATSFVS